MARRHIHLFLPAALLAILTAVATSPALALDPPHDASNGIECLDCHSMQLGGLFSALIPRDAAQETQCKSCHNPTGQASGMTKVSNHLVWHTGTKTTIDCGSCHDPHKPESTTDTHSGGITADNLSLIRKKPSIYWADALSTALFQKRPDHFVFDTSPYNGICQTCHTETDYHLNDGTGSSHNATADCVTCHPHVDGFAPDATCLDCHKKVQDNGDGTPTGGRRAVEPEFSMESHHLLNTTILDADCKVCHEMTVHKDGRVRLFDVDDPNNAAAVFELTGDPNDTAAQASKLDDFCVACHDTNGANGDTTPFGDGENPVVVDSTKWTDSSHSVNAITCYGDGSSFGCHASGHGSKKVTLLAPYDTAATSPDYAEEEEDFCLGCHDGNTATTDLTGEFTKLAAHDVTAYARGHTPGETADGTADHVECGDCHNPHVANDDLPTGGNGIQGQLKGIAGINSSGNAVTTPSYEYEVCYKCHSDGASTHPDRISRESPQADISKRFDTANPSYHPVHGAGANNDVPSLKTGWTETSLITCTDCHNNDDTAGPSGPHGSDWAFLLERRYVTDSNTTESAAVYAMCYKCHDRTSILNDDSFGDHKKHIEGEDASCSVCHDPHGVDDSAGTGGDHTNLINFDTAYVTKNMHNKLEFNDTGNFEGNCSLKCHKKDHRNKSYK